MKFKALFTVKYKKTTATLSSADFLYNDKGRSI